MMSDHLMKMKAAAPWLGRLIASTLFVGAMSALATRIAFEQDFRSYWNAGWLVGLPIIAIAIFLRRHRLWLVLSAFFWLLYCATFVLLNLGGS
jgi:hypothetical protein